MSAALTGVHLLAFGSWGVRQVAALQSRRASGALIDHPRLAALPGLDDMRQEGRLDFWGSD
jgi:hypothetical protein